MLYLVCYLSLFPVSFMTRWHEVQNPWALGWNRRREMVVLGFRRAAVCLTRVHEWEGAGVGKTLKTEEISVKIWVLHFLFWTPAASFLQWLPRATCCLDNGGPDVAHICLLLWGLEREIGWGGDKGLRKDELINIWIHFVNSASSVIFWESGEISWAAPIFQGPTHALLFGES